jgi:hypothetical protein
VGSQGQRMNATGRAGHRAQTGRDNLSPTSERQVRAFEDDGVDVLLVPGPPSARWSSEEVRRPPIRREPCLSPGTARVNDVIPTVRARLVAHGWRIDAPTAPHPLPDRWSEPSRWSRPCRWRLFSGLSPADQSGAVAEGGVQPCSPSEPDPSMAVRGVCRPARARRPSSSATSLRVMQAAYGCRAPHSRTNAVPLAADQSRLAPWTFTSALTGGGTWRARSTGRSGPLSSTVASRRDRCCRPPVNWPPGCRVPAHRRGRLRPANIRGLLTGRTGAGTYVSQNRGTLVEVSPPIMAGAILRPRPA